MSILSNLVVVPILLESLYEFDDVFRELMEYILKIFFLTFYFFHFNILISQFLFYF